jgi:pyruvate ferredoxin oxidoreductase alpha subunit
MSEAVTVLSGAQYSYFRYETHLAALNGISAFAEAAAEFEAVFGRGYRAVESYRTDDAEVVFVMVGSFATKAMAAVDSLRRSGVPAGLVRPLLLRPFPSEDIRNILAGKRGVAVIDQNLSPGFGGVIHSELATALYGRADAPAVLNSFIGGLGGRDISAEEFFEMASVTARAAEDGRSLPPRLLFTRQELAEMRRLQSIAGARRNDRS